MPERLGRGTCERWFELTERAARAAARPTTSSATSSSRRWSAPGRSSSSGSRPTWRRRCARPSATRTGSSRTREWEAAVTRLLPRAVRATRRSSPSFEPFVARVARGGRARGARPAGAEADRARGSPTSTRATSSRYRALVDPDNRRPVDWDWHQAMLQRLMGGSPPVAETRKLFLILRLLGLRARRPGAVRRARYEPLDAGPDVCAFVRGGEVLVAVAVRGTRRRRRRCSRIRRAAAGATCCAARSARSARARASRDWSASTGSPCSSGCSRRRRTVRYTRSDPIAACDELAAQRPEPRTRRAWRGGCNKPSA